MLWLLFKENMAYFAAVFKPKSESPTVPTLKPWPIVKNPKTQMKGLGRTLKSHGPSPHQYLLTTQECSSYLYFYKEHCELIVSYSSASLQPKTEAAVSLWETKERQTLGDHWHHLGFSFPSSVSVFKDLCIKMIKVITAASLQPKTEAAMAYWDGKERQALDDY